MIPYGPDVLLAGIGRLLLCHDPGRGMGKIGAFRIRDLLRVERQIHRLGRFLNVMELRGPNTGEVVLVSSRPMCCCPVIPIAMSSRVRSEIW